MFAKHRTSCILLALASSLCVVGCGDDDDDDEFDEVEPTPAPGAAIVDVQMGEFFVEANPSRVDDGLVAFEATNTGSETHELHVIRTDLAPDQLPTNPDGTVNFEAGGMEEVSEIEEIEPGTTRELQVTLTEGRYVLFCNILEDTDGMLEAHYSEGMRAPFAVGDVDVVVVDTTGDGEPSGTDTGGGTGPGPYAHH
jgi:uncharacterized cupredoxin-like copper-binding protein